MTPDPIEPTAAFAELGRIKFAETDVRGVLDRVTGLARRIVPGASEVSVTVITGGGARTASATGRLALTLDEWQYERGDGPCLAAATGQTTVSVTDLRTESRWPGWAGLGRAGPGWAGLARTTEARSSLSVGLRMPDGDRGALNMYGAVRHAFDGDAIRIAESFARYAEVAVTNARTYDSTATLARQMREAMANRAVIEQAKGIIMGRQHCSADQAFAVLTRLSQDANRKVRDIAADLVTRAAGGDGHVSH